jgi:hypothetical protein
MVIAGARSASRDDAVESFEIVRGARRQGESGHIDVAMLTKDAAGAARHFACGGALLGAALVIVAP